MEQEVTEQWRPGKVEHKVTYGFTYLAAADRLVPQMSKPGSSITRDAARKKKAERIRAKLEALAQKARKRRNDRKAFKTMLLNSGASSHYNKEDDGLTVEKDTTRFVKTASGQVYETKGQATLPFPQLVKDA